MEWRGENGGGRERGHLRNVCSVTVWRSMKDIERKMWKPSERWRKRKGC